MSFGFLQVTAKGRALLARAQIGTASINFTHIKMGNGEMSGQVIDDMIALISLKKELDVTDLVLVSSQQAKVQSVFTNQGLATGFYWREVGVFATDPDDNQKEIMYCYGNAGALADYIPAEGSQILERVISILTIISNAQSVTATIDESLVYSLKSETDAHKNNAELHLAANIPLTDYALPSTGGDIAATDTVNEAIGKLEYNSKEHKADYVRQPGYGVTSGSANTYALTLTPAPVAYVDGMGVVVKINVANTGAGTLNVNGLGAKAIVDIRGNALISGKLRLNGTYSLKYNSSSENFILQGEGGELAKIPNLCKNGNFVSTEMWNSEGLSKFTAVSNVATILAVYGDAKLYQQNISFVSGHKYYLCAKIKTSSSQIALTWHDGSQWGTVYSVASEDYIQYSSITTSLATTANGFVAVIDKNTSGWSDVNIKNIMLLDLTEAYGAGNEPTKAEMDAYISSNGWWDSKLTALTSGATAISKNISTGLVAYANGSMLVGTNASAVDLSAGTDVMYTDAVSKSLAGTTYAESKAVTVNKSGTYRVLFTMGTTNTSNTAYGRIYVNGVAAGTERVTNFNSDTIYTEDISLNAGDRLSIYTKYSPSATGPYIKAFIIKANLASILPTAVLT